MKRIRLFQNEKMNKELSINEKFPYVVSIFLANHLLKKKKLDEKSALFFMQRIIIFHQLDEEISREIFKRM